MSAPDIFTVRMRRGRSVVGVMRRRFALRPRGTPCRRCLMAEAGVAGFTAEVAAVATGAVAADARTAAAGTTPR
jgi:hypothetical protein